MRYGPASSSASIQITQRSTISGNHLIVALRDTTKVRFAVMSRA